ncbi:MULTISPECIES: hypothetical protein [unclassified Mesorhizobium]|uniref:hypothetical protein n=1 Tax=unclassified Mesorhizobium TaxID=325217 RepID=UPI001676C594|nr:MULTISPECIES: hypothetical protein [unclassified Mesorhizobium]
MTKIIPEEKARQGRWGVNVLKILVAGLLLAFVAWGIAEIYGEVIKAPTTEQGPKG